MDIKEKEAFEALQNPKVLQRVAFLPVANAYAVIDEYRDDLFTLEWCEELNFGWRMWQAAIARMEVRINTLDEMLLNQGEALAQAKAQAVPEGFVLVKRVHPDAIVHNQGLGLFKECQVIYGWDGKSKDFKDALNKGFYHGVKLGAKAVLETAILEAQEPANG